MSQSHANAAQSADRAPSAWAWIGLAMLIAPAILHATVGYDPFPDWSADPTVVYTPKTTLGPAESIGLDAIMLAGCLILAITRNARTNLLGCVLALGGSAVAILHNRGPEGIAIGSAWTASIIGALTLAGVVRRSSQLGVAAFAAILGCVFVLAGKGVYQVLVEHPHTVESFRSGRASFFASQGWSEGSPMARAFERRLTQAEASGWFGLANVYATICAGFTAAGLAIAIGALRQRAGDGKSRRIGPLAVATAALVCAVLGVVLAGGKGGYAAAGFGVVLSLGAATISPRPAMNNRRAGAIIGLGAVVGTLGAVVLRGLVGERIGELSLLFRWFYLQGAARAFAHHPLIGTGPAGFKDAYMLYKPPISPEEVTSPHSVLLDYVATLGLGGIAWIALVARLVVAAGIALVQGARERVGVPFAIPTDLPPDPRNTARFVGLVSAAAMLGATAIERPIMTPESAALRIGGVILATILGAVLAGVPRWALRIGASAGAIAMFTHGQIEVTPVWIGSASLLFLTLGLAAGGEQPGASKPTPIPEGRRAPLAIASGVPLAALAALALGISQWQFKLGSAAQVVGEITELKQRVDAVVAGRPIFIGDTLQSIAKDTGGIAAGAVPATVPGLRSTISRLAAKASVEAIADMEAGERALARIHLSSEETLRTRDRLWLLIASIQNAEPSTRTSVPVDALAKIRQVAAADITDASRSGPLAAKATFLRAAAQITGDKSFLAPAIDLFARAAVFDPHGLTYPLEAYQTARDAGNAGQAALWAEKCLELDKLSRLDPLRGLTDQQRQEMTAIPRPHG